MDGDIDQCDETNASDDTPMIDLTGVEDHGIGRDEFESRKAMFEPMNADFAGGKQSGKQDVGSGMNKVDVAEFYSPARVVPAAKARGLDVSDAFSLDFTTADGKGDRWDFDCKRMRRKAIKKAYEEEPSAWGAIC